MLGEDNNNTTALYDTALYNARLKTPLYNSLLDRSDDNTTVLYNTPIEAQNNILAVAIALKPRLLEALESRTVAVRVPSKGS